MSAPADTTTTEFHARLVERRVNEVLGGDATVRELVTLMVEMGWKPPDVPQPSARSAVGPRAHE